MGNLVWQWLRHAFAVDPPGPALPSPSQREVCDRFLREIVRRGMTAPALLWLEASQSWGEIGAQFLHFCEPVLTAVCDAAAYRDLAKFLQRRGACQYLCQRLEEIDREHSATERDVTTPMRDDSPPDLPVP